MSSTTGSLCTLWQRASACARSATFSRSQTQTPCASSGAGGRPRDTRAAVRCGPPPVRASAAAPTRCAA
eukprot:7212303-Prymnesium_polylepis.1